MVTLGPRWLAFTLHQSAWLGEFGLEKLQASAQRGVNNKVSFFSPLHSCQPGFTSFVLYPDIEDMTCSKRALETILEVQKSNLNMF